MENTEEYVILYDRLRDPDVLCKLLGRDVYKDISVEYLDIKWLYKYHLYQLNHLNSILKLKLTENDLAELDKYYGCMYTADRVATVLFGKVCWVYINKNE